MIIHLDTSLLIEAVRLPGVAPLRQPIESGHILTLSTIVLFEWLRGPRTPDELRVQELLFPEAALIPFEINAARTAARIYQSVKKPRSREFDIAIAACAIEHGAALWTLNPRDFSDLPGLTLYSG